MVSSASRATPPAAAQPARHQRVQRQAALGQAGLGQHHDQVLHAHRVGHGIAVGRVVDAPLVGRDPGLAALLLDARSNDNEYGLSAAVFSRDIARAMTVAKRIESGICHINGPTVQDEAQMPFGGVKVSGYGRFGGRAGVDAFTELRWVTVQTGERHYPF